MTDQNIVPIRTSGKQQEAVARTANGERITLNDCERLLAAHQGFEADIREIDEVDVEEIDAAGHRAYRVPLRHTFE